jgi:hypothetical protein
MSETISETMCEPRVGRSPRLDLQGPNCPGGHGLAETERSEAGLRKRDQIRARPATTYNTVAALYYNLGE